MDDENEKTPHTATHDFLFARRNSHITQPDNTSITLSLFPWTHRDGSLLLRPFSQVLLSALSYRIDFSTPLNRYNITLFGDITSHARYNLSITSLLKQNATLIENNPNIIHTESHY